MKPQEFHHRERREKNWFIKTDDLVKSLKGHISVIPAKAGIQLSPLTLPLSPGNGGEGGGEGEE